MPPKPLILILLIPLILISVVGIAFSLSVYAAEPTGLVTCGLMSSKTLCTICDLITLFQTLVEKANSYFALPLAALMLGYGGFLMVLSGFQGGNAGLYTKGKTVLTNTAIGIVIIFCSWLAIDTLLKTIGAYQHAESSYFGPWNKIECVSPAIRLPKHFACKDDRCVEVDGFARAGCTNHANCTEHQHLGCVHGSCTIIRSEAGKDQTGADECTISPESCPPEHFVCIQGSCTPTTAANVITDDCKIANGNRDCEVISRDFLGVDAVVNKKAAEDLKNQRVIFSSSGDCKGADGNQVSAETNLQEMLNQRPLTICHAECKTDGKPCLPTSITANDTMMYRLARVRESGKKFTVNSITTGEHKPDSDHYRGNAVDLSAVEGTTYPDLKAQFEPGLFNGIRLAQCENERGRIVADCGSSTRHLHISYKE